MPAISKTRATPIAGKAEGGLRHVFLVHGMGRTSASMSLLAWRLGRLGYQTHRFDYLVSRDDLQTIASRFALQATEVMADAGPDHSPYAVIGHSLGNIVARLASPALPPGFHRFVMLAPPNRPPIMARRLKHNPLFRFATRDAGQKIGDERFHAALPRPEVPSLIIAGDRGPRSPWLPFRGAPNDSVVAVAETVLEDTPSLIVPGIHTFLMNRQDVLEAIRAFLATELLETDQLEAGWRHQTDPREARSQEARPPAAPAKSS